VTSLRPALCALALLLVTQLACPPKPKIPADWVARVGQMTGDVTVTEAPGQAAAPAKLGQYLLVGAELKTGPASNAVLELRNGGSLTVKPNSLVALRSSMPKQLSVSLPVGSLIANASSVTGSELVIGVGGHQVKLNSAAQAEVTSKGDKAKPDVTVILDKATVVTPEGTKEVVSKEMIIPRSTPDARAARPDAGEVKAKEIVFFLQASGRGKVLIKRPGETKFTAIRKGEAIEITAGTELKLVGKAVVTVGPEKGKGGTTLTGPAQVRVEKDPTSDDSKPTVRLSNTGNEIQLSATGDAGKAAAPFEENGVKVIPRVAYKRLELKVRKEKGRSILSVIAGAALLEGKDRKVELEAGQDAVLSRGAITGPNMPQPAPMEVKSGGAMRVFTANASLPVTFRWNAGKEGAVVEVSRSPGFDHPIFSDLIKRHVLTVPPVARGTVFWRVRPLEGGVPAKKGTDGKLVLLKDTSHRTLKDRQAPKNFIHESGGNTTVFYQNILPRFTFRWDATGASKYTMKLFREQSLTKPIYQQDTRGTELALPTGKLGEGTYIWYIVAAERTPRMRKLTIRYDNATPDLQIVYPPNGITVGEAALETNGVTIPGSKVSINGVRAELDETFRFTHKVPLKAGTNLIIYLVMDPRRGSSYYLRQITRK